MTNSLDVTPSTIDRIRHDLVGLKMRRALEALDHVVRRLEQGEIAALEVIDILLSEELTLRENSRIKTALRMGRLATIKTLAGFDFAFQPSLDRDRLLTLAQLGFVARGEVVHFQGPRCAPGLLRLPGGTLGPPADLEPRRERLCHCPAPDGEDKRRPVSENRPPHGLQAPHRGLEDLAQVKGRKSLADGDRRRQIHRRRRDNREHDQHAA